ncbi:hypothetical protein OQA88_12027 [Cercophora sp. LCS_1]
MGHAWLDSLSEDWVSQPGSADVSTADTAPLHSATGPKRDDVAANATRIPRLNHSPKRPGSQQAGNENGSGILSERSVNEIFVSASRRTPSKAPSKLSQEIKVHQRGRYASRSVSASTAGSVVHNTVQQKSLSASPSKRGDETPEWKRRLVYGELSYGEQPDLFTSAGTGLENIFKPPPAVPDVPSANDESYEDDGSVQHETTMPSSPPLYARDPSTVEIIVDESLQELPRLADKRAPTSMRYRRADESVEPTIDSVPSSMPETCTRGASTTEQTAFSANQPDRLSPDSRKVSGRSDIRNEDFSPILLERRQASNGKPTFGPADLPPDELRKRLEKLRRNQMLLTGDYEPSDNQGNVESTDFLERMGGFINFRRGGRSGDGSFRHHVLSSGINDTSELCPEESLQASTPKQFPTVRNEDWEESKRFSAVSPDLPRPPNPSPLKRGAHERVKSGSPLKLFQPYDTFTNQILFRRLSQFQGEEADETSADVDNRGEPGLETPIADQSAAQQIWEDEEASRLEHSINQFGTGHFDGYEFNDEFSYQSNDVSGLDGDKENWGPEEVSDQPPHPRIFDVTHSVSPSEVGEELMVQRKRQKSDASASSRRPSVTPASDKKRELRVSFPPFEDILATPRRRDKASEIKRPRTSPSKDPTPKRRRTLHKSDVAYGIEESQAIDSVQMSHHQMQTIMGRKSNDAHHEDADELTDADGLPNRQVFRPRTPTPPQRPLQRDRLPLAEIEKSPARALRKPLPPTPQPFGSTVDAERKPSIKTEDFINEANKIMAMIRSKAGLASGLASLEESDAEHLQQQSPEMDSSYQSTQEPFSRPPSREGRAPIARISTRQEDPEVVERLKKYEEPSDMNDIIGSSVRSVSLAQEALRAARDRQQGMGTTSTTTSRPSIMDADEVCDPPNIRISHSPDWQPADSLHSGVLSNGSTGSHSSGRSITTGSSRGSESKKVIAPESVVHLIGEQVGNMVLDKQRNIWIKRKPNSGRRKPKANFLPSEASEDDPFADIPDLSVDMTMELQNLKLMSAQKPPATWDAPANKATPPGAATANSTRMSSGSETVAQQSRTPAKSPKLASGAVMGDDEGEVEHEISINDSRVDTRKRRNLTISFSSPVASFIQDRLDDAAADHQQADKSDDEYLQDSLRRGRKVSSGQTTAPKGVSRSRSRSQGPARHLSVRGQTFVARPVSRIDEREEESILDRVKNRRHANMELSILAENSVVGSGSGSDSSGARKTSVSFVVTPARPRDCPAEGADAAPVISQYVGMLSLSPMSEFTVHHGEDSLPLEASYVVGDHRLVTGDHSKRVMSMNTRDLVAKIAEVEPFEPCWDELRELELREKRIGSVHGLNEFCTSLEKLDVSNNEIRNLGGIPSSVRHLKIAYNQLSGLTAWGHLMNLQYVDVSNNGITSLAAFKNLVHLRSLRVDNNQLTSLDGIKFHDGLQVLRARNNAIRELDFDSNTLSCLTDLDLKNNKIQSISNLEQLSALESLNLEGNELSGFSVSSESPMTSLRYLYLGDNELSSLDLKNTPHIRLLHADRNHLSQISGFSRARKIDSLSLREQRGATPLDLAHLLSRAYEVRKLFLSGNFISEFAPTVDLLNLQLLELANCGLRSLPENVGFMLPNLRALNLNMNALSDLAPLRCIPRLKRVLISGNRISDSAALVDTLSGFEHLREVDARDNPVTLGFYAPVQVVVRRDSREEAKGAEPFVLHDQEVERDEAYCGRLDMETRMRRRLYESLVVGGCKKVKKLDGLTVDRKGMMGRRDGVWKALREKGFIDGDEDDSRWGAEDSFA